MSRGVNKVILVGNVGADPEVRSTPGGTRLAKVSLATNETYKNRDGQLVEDVQWHRLTFWRGLAEVVEKYVTKGDRIYIEGKVKYSTTGEGDDKRYFTDIEVRELLMLGANGGGGGGGGEREWGAPAGGSSTGGGSPFDEDDDDLPF